MLAKLPQDRSMIVKTSDITSKVDEIAGFLGIPPETLIKENTHLHKSNKKINILNRFDYDFLRSKFDEHCSGLMEEFFPGYTLKGF